jgi:hypothetical protein
MRSVRAWCVLAGKDPKRVPPAGYRAAGLVLACPNAVAMLATARAPEGTRARVVVTEGDPDFLTWATRYSDASEDAPAIFGVVSGSWSTEFAERIPVGSKVIVRTHADVAGDGYARLVQRYFEGRCDVWRTRVA